METMVFSLIYNLYSSETVKTLMVKYSPAMVKNQFILFTLLLLEHIF
jgi:hypothetical protein